LGAGDRVLHIKRQLLGISGGILSKIRQTDIVVGVRYKHNFLCQCLQQRTWKGTHGADHVKSIINTRLIARTITLAFYNCEKGLSSDSSRESHPSVHELPTASQVVPSNPLQSYHGTSTTSSGWH
jgi:hypothetical protein